jgi:hypothetical protein
LVQSLELVFVLTELTGGVSPNLLEVL